MDSDRQVRLLRTWAKIGRQMAQSRSAAPRWEAAHRMIGAAVPLFKALAEELNDLLTASDNLLKPLTDPLRTDFGAHGWLSGEREEAYSDWLKWIVQNLASTDVLRLFAINELFMDKPHEIIELGRETQPEVRREVCVPRGHPEKEGRLDLVISLEERVVIVVETKVGHADTSDTAKQHGYGECLKKQEGEIYPILLATDGDKQEYAGGFRLLRWADLCLALRRVVAELCAKQQIVIAAMTLAFVGAVERNLLGFSIRAVDHVQLGRLATFDPRVSLHLERWVNAERNE